MSETPRTDAEAFPILSRLQSGTEDVVPVALARQLERELAVEKEAAVFFREKAAAAIAERDALRADAERYRWLRRQDWEKAALCVVTNPKANVRLGTDCPSRDRLDTAIDRERK